MQKVLPVSSKSFAWHSKKALTHLKTVSLGYCITTRQ